MVRKVHLVYREKSPLSVQIIFNFQFSILNYIVSLHLKFLKMSVFEKKKIQQVIDILRDVRKIAIISHFNPDGDAVGSELALYHYLKNIGYDVTAILPNPYPGFLAWMPLSSEIVVAEHARSKARQILKKADLIFIVDMNAPHRCGNILEDTLANSSAHKVLIDHHILPDFPCDVMFSTPKTTSTCELVYQFLNKISGKEDKITQEIASCIYVGMITDTGSLSYACNSPLTYSIISKLMKKGINGEQIHRDVYDNYEESRFKLLGLCLNQRLTLMRDFSTSYMYLDLTDLKVNKYKVGDTEGFVNYGLSLRGIQFTAFFTEREDRIRISFRSKGNFDVSHFARTHFNGGGHKNASAAFYYGSLEDAIAHFKEAVQQYADVLNPENFK